MESKAEEDLPHVNSNRDTQGASDALTADNNTLHRRTSLPVTIRNDNLCCDTNKPSFTANEIAIDQFVSKEQKIKVKVSKQLPPDLEPRARCKEEQREAGHFLKERQDISWKAKAVVLFSMLIMPVGCHYMEATLGTLKTTLKHSMNINNTQFSILMSAVSVVNTVLPFFAGAFADDFNSSIGTVRGTLATSMVIFVGSLLVSVAVNNNNYPMMLAGQVIYGLGDGVIVTFQEAILSRWFRNKQLSIVVGIMLSVARLTKFIAKAVCYPLADYAGTTTRPVTVAMILCALSVVANMAYWCVMVKQDFATLLGKEKHMLEHTSTVHSHSHSKGTTKEKEDEKASSGTKRYKRLKQDAFHYSTLLYLPSTFWMMPWLQFTMSSVLSSFTDIATEFVQFRFKTTRVKAGYVSSLTQLAPIVLAPLLGLYAHRYGKRLYMLFAGVLVLLTGLVLLSYTWTPPDVGIMLISIALSLGPVSILSSSALLVPTELVGVAIGLHKCSNNIGSTILSVIVGYVQDLTFHDGDASDDATDMAHEYDRVLNAYLGITVLALVLAVCFLWLDKKKLNGWLQVNRKERERRLTALIRFSEEQNELDLSIKELDDKPSHALQVITTTTTTTTIVPPPPTSTMTAYTYTYNDKEGEYEKLRTEVGSQLRRKRSFVYIGVFLLFLLFAWVVFFTFVLMPLYQHYDVR